MSRLRRLLTDLNIRMERIEQETMNMSAQSEEVLAEVKETKGKVATLVTAVAAIREELEQVKNQSDPHLVEAIAISNEIQANADSAMANTGPPSPEEEPPFEPSQN